MTYVAFTGLWHLQETPPWFRNFLRLSGLPKKSDSWRWSIDSINQALMSYHAVIYNRIDEITLEFATEQDYVMFVLRWS